jgi:hypothetical protein
MQENVRPVMAPRSRPSLQHVFIPPKISEYFDLKLLYVWKNGFHFYQKFFDYEHDTYLYNHRKIKDKIYILSSIDNHDNM